MKTSSRDPVKESYWREIIQRQRQSGKNQTQFCREEGLADDKFSYWKRALLKRQKEKKLPSIEGNKVGVPFVPVNIQSNLSFTNKGNVEQIEISKIAVRIAANIDKTTLACILQSLDKSQC